MQSAGKLDETRSTNILQNCGKKDDVALSAIMIICSVYELNHICTADVDESKE